MRVIYPGTAHSRIPAVRTRETRKRAQWGWAHAIEHIIRPNESRTRRVPRVDSGAKTCAIDEEEVRGRTAIVIRPVQSNWMYLDGSPIPNVVRPR